MTVSSELALLSGLFDHASIGMALVGMDGRWLRVNRAMCKLVGYDQERLLGEHFQGITHPEDRYKDASFVEKLLAGESDGYRVEKRFVHEDGHVVWAEVAASRIHTKSQDHCLFVIQDIGSRKEMEQALHRSEESFRTLIEGAPDAVCVHMGGVIRYTNPAFGRLLGRSGNDDFVGLALAGFLTPADRLRIRAVVDGESTGKQTYAAHFLHHDGGEIYCEVAELPMMRGNEPAKILLLRDLSEREASFRKLLQADRLTAMGTLAAGIAHEINNPLALVVANLELALEQLASGPKNLDVVDLAEILGEAREGAHRVRNVVRNMRQLSTAEDATGESVLVDVAKSLDSALGLLLNQLKHRALLTKDVETVPRVRARPEEVEQLLVNLLLHAGRTSASEHGLVSVTVRVRFVEGNVMIEVEDTHEPLTKDLRDHLFDPFYASGARDQAELGLGLAVSHSLVQQMGGEIVAEDLPAGNLLRVLLPPAEGHKRRVSSRPPQRRASSATAQRAPSAMPSARVPSVPPSARAPTVIPPVRAKKKR